MSKRTKQRKRSDNFWLHSSILIVVALVLHIIIRTFVFEIFRVPSGSMIPNILVGDHIFVTKYSYGYGPHSSVISLPLKGRMFFNMPNRGDIVVFQGAKNVYVKRLVGLPGDRVQMVNGRVKLNGVFLQRTLSDEPYVDMNGVLRKIDTWDQFYEKLDDDTAYVTIKAPAAKLWQFPDTTAEYVVPEKHYFMLGDNRNYSTDSRFIHDVGFVHEDNLKGKARFVLYNSKFLKNFNSSSRLFHHLA